MHRRGCQFIVPRCRIAIPADAVSNRSDWIGPDDDPRAGLGKGAPGTIGVDGKVAMISHATRKVVRVLPNTRAGKR